MANLSNINNVLRVSSDLRVGINTDAASYALEIGGTNSGIKLKNSGGSGKVYSLLSDTSGNFQIYDDAAASGRLVINSAGNATFAGSITSQGISASSLTTPLIQLQGDFNVLNKAQTSYITLADRDTSGSEVVYNLANVGSATFAGNVGIGISPGGNNLHIYKSNATALIQASNTSGIAQVQFFPRDASNVAHLQSIKGVDSSLTFLTGGNSGNSYVPTERMVIDSLGNVGIKNTSPSDFLSWQQQLVVGNGSADAGITIYHGSGGGNQGAIVFADGNTGTDRYRGSISYNGADEMKFFTSTLERIKINDAGNVFISTPITNAFYGLSLTYNNNNTADFTVNQATGQIKIGGVATGYFPTFYSAGVERMRIDSSGKIQVGSDKVIWAGGYGGGLVIRQNNATGDRLIKMVTVDSTGAIVSDNVLVAKGASVGIGINSPAAKLHVQASNAQMLIGYSGNSQNFFDADNHYFRNSAFVNILQLGGDTILGTPNNTQRLRITTDYSQIGPMIVKYPYYRMDSFKSDGSGYFWAFGHEKSDGTQSIGMMLNDGVSGNKYTRIINTLQIASFASNEYNGAYPSFTTNVVLRNSGDSYLNGGKVGIGVTGPTERLTVDGVIANRTASADPNFTVATSNMSIITAGSLQFTQGFAGTSSAGDTVVFRYNAVSWKSWSLDYTFASTNGMVKGTVGGYNNNSGGYNNSFLSNQYGLTCVVTNVGQHVVVTFTGNFGVHMMCDMRYSQGGGDSSPVASRASLTYNS